jgi:site-specific DNA-cytosine methylase
LISVQSILYQALQSRLELELFVCVREYARGQGFPSSLIFDMNGRAELAIRGIGNAVAVPVALAIGREFFHVLVD